MTDELRVGVVQMSSQDDVATNLAHAVDLIDRAAAEGAKVVLLPENFAYMGTDDGKRSIAEQLDGDARGPILKALADAARRVGVYIIAGGMPERSGDAERPHNTCAVVGPGGAVVARYRKVHLFDVEVGDGQRYRESASTAAGSEAVAVSILGMKVGLSVCYDLRFPELYRKLADLGSDLVVVPAAFTLATGKDHWHVLLRARAIESQAYVVAAAQCGTHPHGRRTYGKSLIVDPWGDVIAQCSDGEGVAVATVDRRRIERIRASLPSLRHRRL